MSSEDIKDPKLINQKEKLGAFSYDDVPSEALTSQNVGEILDNLDNINDVSDIENMQKKLQGDYKLLAKQFGNSRISRVETFISKIEELQNQLRKNSIAHDTFVNNNLPQLDEETSMEVDSVTYAKSLKRRRNHFDDAAAQTGDSSPPPEAPASPPLEELPIFTDSFEQVLKPHRDSLKALRSKYDYEAKLIEDSARRNVELTWRQSAKDRIELRKQMRSEISQKIIDLDKDYNNENRYAKVSHNERRFRTSTRKVGERKGGRYGVMEVHREVESRVRRFNNSFHSDSRPVSGASASEIDNDLSMMKSPYATVKIETIEANYLYQEQPLKKENIGPTTMTDLVNSEIEERGIAGMQYQVSTDRTPYQPPSGYNYNYQPPQQQQQPRQPPQQQFPSPYPQQQQSPYLQYQQQQQQQQQPLPAQGFFNQQQPPPMINYYPANSPYQQQPQMQGQYPLYPQYRPQQ